MIRVPWLGFLLFAVTCIGLSSPSVAETENIYAGSSACKGCHVPEGNSWSQTLHSRMMRTAEEDKEIGVVDWRAAKPPFPPKDVAYVLGNMRKLVFLKKGTSGFVVLPRQYNLVAAAWEPLSVGQWDHFFGSNGGGPNGSETELSWNDRCAGCHSTGYDPAERTFAEASIACESCHGPGAKHAASQSRDDIANPTALRGERANYVCAQCHTRGNDASGKYPYPVGFKSGRDLTDYFVFAEPVKGENSELFWGNGMARKHHAQYNELRQSKHLQNGLRCFDCHEVHSFRSTSSSPETRLIARTERFLLKNRARFICFKCHTTRDAGFRVDARTTSGKMVDRHTHHPPEIVDTLHIGKPGAETRMEVRRMHCGDCHMPREETGAASYDIRAHTFKIPNPSDTIAYGAPNACNDCHSTESPKWAEQWIVKWRGEQDQVPPPTEVPVDPASEE